MESRAARRRGARAVRRAASHKANVFVNTKDVLVNIRHMLYTLSVCYILHVKVCVWPLRLARCYSPRRFQSVRPGVHLSESVVNHIAITREESSQYLSPTSQAIGCRTAQQGSS